MERPLTPRKSSDPTNTLTSKDEFQMCFSEQWWGGAIVWGLGKRPWKGINHVSIHCSIKCIYSISYHTFVNHTYYRKELMKGRKSCLFEWKTTVSKQSSSDIKRVAPNGPARNHMLVLAHMLHHPSVHSLFYLETKHRVDGWMDGFFGWIGQTMIRKMNICGEEGN